MRSARATPMRETPWGRFTVYGDEALEGQATALAAAIRGAASEHLPPSSVRALVLLGGYGRGEGGVELVEGRQRLHNNFDILLVHPAGRAPTSAHRSALRRAFEVLEEQFDVGIDFACQPDAYLRRAPSLVMWYDMRHGHKTLLGDADFVPSLSRFSVDRIPEYDIRNLLVNRASLLVINEFLLDQVADPDAVHRTIVKHTAKAIIGYGDALLHLNGQYHWSYRVKQERMRSLYTVPAAFRSLYDQSATFRLLPRYDQRETGDLRSWLSGLIETLEPVHLGFEAARLASPDLTWTDYPRVSAWREVGTDLHVPRRTAAKILNLFASPSGGASHKTVHGLARRALGVRGLLPIALPAVLYPSARSTFGAEIARAFGLRSTDPRELRRAFLRHWRDHADPNLDLALGRLGVDPTAVRGSA